MAEVFIIEDIFDVELPHTVPQAQFPVEPIHFVLRQKYPEDVTENVIDFIVEFIKETLKERDEDFSDLDASGFQRA